jgi:hypothetical protein
MGYMISRLQSIGYHFFLYAALSLAQFGHRSNEKMFPPSNQPLAALASLRRALPRKVPALSWGRPRKLLARRRCVWWY